ncbi:MAG TPA: hypothetical protein VMD53_13575 [Rhizomicrobium sp.]|nr:hypothetical protein [Rhizomicrobium sp.]
MGQQLLFKLDQTPNGRGLRCDADGLFLGREALLQRDAEGNFEARPADELQKILGRAYGYDANWESRVRSVKLVALALNKGDLARAMVTAVLMRLPEPGSPISIADVDGVLAKAGFDRDEPRDERGRWTTDGNEVGESAAPNARHRVQPADSSTSGIEAEVRATEAAGRASVQPISADELSPSRFRPINKHRRASYSKKASYCPFRTPPTGRALQVYERRRVGSYPACGA